MKDVLVQKDLERIKDLLASNFDGRFCYYRDLNGRPEKTKPGKKILFSDGRRVRGESVLIEVYEGELRFEPLTPVERPNPDSPPARGFKYVDAADCGKYSIEFVGMEHSFKTFKDLVRGILRNVPEARNSLDELKYQIWISCQDLDFSDREDFEERIPSGDIKRVLEEVQLQDCFYPPTDPEVLRKRFNRSSKGSRIYNLEDFVRKAVEFYREKGEISVAEDLEEAFELSVDSDRKDVAEIVKEKVSGGGEL